MKRSIVAVVGVEHVDAAPPRVVATTGRVVLARS
jgi:hypothetical protein